MTQNINDPNGASGEGIWYVSVFRLNVKVVAFLISDCAGHLIVFEVFVTEYLFTISRKRPETNCRRSRTSFQAHLGRPGLVAKEGKVHPSCTRAELRLGITPMLCQLASPASVDYRLQDFRRKSGV